MKPKILVVDDEYFNRVFLQKALTREGYDVVLATNGIEALEFTRKNVPDLIILDVMMPGIDGFEVCRRLKARQDTKAVPVLLVTALESVDDKVTGMEAGADDFISKPFHLEELLARLRSNLRNRVLYLEIENSYRILTEHIAHTELLLKDFDPYEFDAFNTENQLIRTFLLYLHSKMNCPLYLLLCEKDHREPMKCKLYRRGVRKRKHLFIEVINLNRGKMLPLMKDGKIYMANFPASGSRIWKPPENLKKLIGEINNFVSYCGGNVLFVTLNYPKKVNRFDGQILKSLAIHHRFFDTISDEVKDIENAFRYLTNALARAAEANDEDTGKHIKRIMEYTAFIAGEYGLPPRKIEKIKYSSQMHDVGKVHIHPDILRKPAPLTREEFEVIKQHTIFGAEIIGDEPRLSVAKNIALYHHEFWDGTGYPYGLKGEQIPLEARIVTLADVYDALRSSRPYKASFPHSTAVSTILEGDGRTKPSQFDPKILDIFNEKHSVFDDIYEAFKD